MAYLTLTAMLALVLWPLLVPAMVHGSHAITHLRRKPASQQPTMADNRAA